MGKLVTEMEMKFYESFISALENRNSKSEIICFEGSVPPLDYRLNENELYRLKTFQRGTGIDRYIEVVYILFKL